MKYIESRRRRSYQPQERVAPAGDLLQGLAGLWVPGLGNLAGSLGGLLRSDESAPFGRANRLNNGSSERTTLTSSASWVPTSGGYSLILLRRFGSAIGTGDSYGVGASGTLTHRAGLTFTTGTAYFDYGGGTEGTTRTSGAVSTAAGDIHCFVATTGPAGMRIFCDGRLIASNTANPTRVNGGIFGFVLGAGYGGTSGQWSAGLAGAWARQLPDNLAARLSAEPWSAFAPVERRVWVPVSAGGGAVTVTGQSVAQATQSTAGAISQTHLLGGAPCTQANQSSSAAVTQTHVLAGQSINQSNTCAAGAVGAITPHTLAGTACSQANGSTAGAVTQVHLLAGAASQQVNTSTAGAVSAVPVITLTGAACSQANTSTGAPVTQTHVLMAAPVAVDHIASASAIVQTHMLAGSNCSQVNTCTAGAVSDGTSIVTPWPTGRADPQHQAVVPFFGVRAMVPVADVRAVVTFAGVRAIVQQDTP